MQKLSVGALSCLSNINEMLLGCCWRRSDYWYECIIVDSTIFSWYLWKLWNTFKLYSLVQFSFFNKATMAWQFPNLCVSWHINLFMLTPGKRWYPYNSLSDVSAHTPCTHSTQWIMQLSDSFKMRPNVLSGIDDTFYILKQVAWKATLP